jgi:hypothetical protein
MMYRLRPCALLRAKPLAKPFRLAPYTRVQRPMIRSSAWTEGPSWVRGVCSFPRDAILISFCVHLFGTLRPKVVKDQQVWLLPVPGLPMIRALAPPAMNLRVCNSNQALRQEGAHRSNS